MALRKRACCWRKRAWRGAIVKVARGNSILKEVPLSSVLFSWDVRGTPSTKSTVTECMKQVMVVTRSFGFFYVLICCFTSMVSSWCHVGTVSY